MATTRVIHQVRCRSKLDPQLFADVAILDAVAMLKPDGTAVLWVINRKSQNTTVNPAIVDEVSDDQKYKTGDPQDCTRLSHMDRFTSQTDPTQKLDLEILDAFVLQPPQIGELRDASLPESIDNPGGQVDSGDLNGAMHAIFMSKQAKTTIVDDTGLNLDKDEGPEATRSGHISIVTDKGNTDDKNAEVDAIPPNARPYLAAVIPDALNVVGPNGNNFLFVLNKGVQEEIDTTKFVTDPYSGEQCPPDNKDPNIYVGFPDDSQGGNLGKNPTSTLTGNSGPINQGIFWWIKKIAEKPNPWFWYATPQDYLSFSFFGAPPEAANPKWGYLGWQLLNSFPVIWILSENTPMSPMGRFGSPSLELCLEEGSFLSTGDMPSGPMPVNATPAVSALSLIALGTVPGGGGIPINNAEDGNPGGPFGPFGIMNFVTPPSDDHKIAIGEAKPNYFQLTGVTQPNLQNPNLPWNVTDNPYLWPTPSKAEQVAKTFATNWQATAAAMNAMIASWVPGGGSGNGAPPAWPWATAFAKQTPLFDQDGARTYIRSPFANGIQPTLVEGTLPGTVYNPASTWTLDVDQADPKIWDTSHTLHALYSPLLGFAGSVPFPVTWESEKQPP